MSSVHQAASSVPRMAGALQIFATGPAGESRSLALQSGTGVFIGASPQCGLQLRGADIADIHCRLTYQDGRLTVQQWMHACGTRVNGQSFDSECVLQAEDCLEVGAYRIGVKPDTLGAAGANHSTAGAARHSTDVEPAVADRTVKAAEPGTSEQTIIDETTTTRETPSRDDSSCEAEPDFDALMIDTGFDALDSDDDDETFDRETVDLLRAEIAHLQAALAAQEALDSTHPLDVDDDGVPAVESGWAPDQSPSSDSVDVADDCLRRMDELIDEANRSDERVAILEEMLQAAELANRFEQEERAQLEAWVGDIEKRVGQREQEHLAETESYKNRLHKGEQQVHQLQRKLHRMATQGKDAAADDHTLEELQANNHQLQVQVVALQQQNAELNRKLINATETEDARLREERAELAKQHAELSRLRFEVSSKLADIESFPKAQTEADKEAATRIHALREHLREIHQQESLTTPAARETSLSSRLSRLWNRLQ